MFDASSKYQRQDWCDLRIQCPKLSGIVLFHCNQHPQKASHDPSLVLMVPLEGTGKDLIVHFDRLLPMTQDISRLLSQYRTGKLLVATDGICSISVNPYP